jgi:hypothetical protein
MVDGSQLNCSVGIDLTKTKGAATIVRVYRAVQAY